MLRERAEVLDIAPAGRVSAGGTCRLLRAGDGAWLAINLARRDDLDLLAAWMGHAWSGPPWEAVAGALAGMSADAAVERAQLLGIPAAGSAAPATRRDAVVVTPGASSPRSDLVVDLSALWAGPLCARLLGRQGLRVVKVEDARRPDGARAGDPRFWELLNGGKEEVVLDLSRGDGRTRLDTLLDEARVVVTSARARAVDQLGLGLDERVRARGLTWVAITGYGLAGGWADRVAFGDDAAVAGGLAHVAGDDDGPAFVLDAPADPLAGLRGAVAAVGTMAQSHGAVVDVSMRDVVAASLTVPPPAHELQGD